nr:hypothetical protein [Variovorax paradoxus]
MASETLHYGVGVGAMVIHDQMQLLVLGRLALDQAQELQPLRVPVLRLTHRDHGAVQRVQGGDERGRARTNR